MFTPNQIQPTRLFVLKLALTLASAAPASLSAVEVKPNDARQMQFAFDGSLPRDVGYFNNANALQYYHYEKSAPQRV